MNADDTQQAVEIARWSHLVGTWGFIGRLVAIRAALAYDMGDLMARGLGDALADDLIAEAWSRHWHANMAAWKLAALP
jgi:hypothetical protein